MSDLYRRIRVAWAAAQDAWHSRDRRHLTHEARQLDWAYQRIDQLKSDGRALEAERNDALAKLAGQGWVQVNELEGLFRA